MWIIREQYGIIRIFSNYEEAEKRYNLIIRNDPNDDIEFYHIDFKNEEQDGTIINSLKSTRGSYLDILNNISTIINAYMNNI